MKKYFLILYFSSFSFYFFSQNPGDTIFNSPHIHTINITLSQPNFWDSLMYYKQHADSFNLSTQAMKGAITFDGTLIDSVGVQLKGNSSFGYPGRKKPIKLTFNQYISGQKLEGLTAIDLNNNALDPTNMREKLMLDFMNKKGLPAPRCTYAKVSYNGQYVGLYKIIEQVDKEFVITHFANWGGNLFKGDPMGNLVWVNNAPASYYNYYELHSNSITNNWSDLVNLIDNINNTPAPVFYDTLETNFNTSSFIKQWAARNLFVDLDSYFHAPHNYYLYHNTVTNKFEWATWDVSVSFGFYPYWSEDSTEHVDILSSNLPLTTKMLADTNYKTAYLNTICDYLTYFDTIVMFPVIDSIANLIYPAFAAEPDSNQMFPEQALYWTCDTFTVHTPVGDIPALKKFISKRRAIVISQLNSLGWTCTTAMNEPVYSREEIRVFPNPSGDKIKFVFSQEKFQNSEKTFSLFNSLGQVVMKKENIRSESFEISRNGLDAGIYFYKVTTADNYFFSGKIVIE